MDKFGMRAGKLSMAACAALTAIVGVPAANASPPPGAISAPTAAVQRDIAAYAQAYGVSAQEALRRLHIQEAAGVLNARLSEDEVATFAGLYIAHTPRMRVVARFTHDAERTLARHVGKGTLADVAQAQGAEVPLARLVAAQTAAYESVRASGVPVSGSINLEDNRAEIYVEAKNVSRASETVAAAVSTNLAAERVKVVTVAQLPKDEANLYGGLEIVGGGAVSTTGFTVRRDSDGRMGVTAAGHAPNSGTVRTTSGSVATTFEAERAPSGPYDIQWHSASGHNLTNSVQDNTNGATRPITSIRLRANQVVGSSVCKYGRTTGYTCGTINTTSLCNNGSCTYVRVSGGSVNLSEGGDSGGPWFFGNTAFGTHCIGMGNDAGYMPVDYINQGLGVSVHTGTSPGPGVSFYLDCDHGAFWRTLDVGSYVVQSADNLISSIKVPAGYRVTLFDANNLTGPSTTKTADDGCLVDDGWNDRVSSLRIERI